MLDIKKADFSFERIIEWPLKLQIIGIGVLCLSLIFIGYLIDFRNVHNATLITRENEIVLVGQLKNKALQSSELIQFDNQAKQANKIITNLLKQLTNTSDDETEFLSNVYQTAESSNLTVGFLKPLPIQPEKLYAKVPIKIVVNGTFGQLATFISNLANRSQIISFDSLTLEHLDRQKLSNKLSMELIAAVYKKPEKITKDSI